MNKNVPQVCPICGSPVQEHPECDVWECLNPKRGYKQKKACGVVFYFQRIPVFEKLRDNRV